MTAPGDPELWRLAEEVCTDAELQALELNRRGFGYRRISLILGISVSASRDRVQRAVTKIRRASEEGEDGQDA